MFQSLFAVPQNAKTTILRKIKKLTGLFAIADFGGGASGRMVGDVNPLFVHFVVKLSDEFSGKYL